jgi:CRISPR/Cas system-associated exonuclease Cas4 (RecB family)
MADHPLTLLSQSSLQDYMDCSLRFKLRYLERLSYPAMESEPALENEKHQQEGEYFHRLLQQYLIGIPGEYITRLANTPNLQRWWSNFLADPGLQTLRECPGLHPEANLSAPLGKHRLLAKYDLIVIRDGKATIYDWKTYRKQPRKEWLSARMQTRVYRSLLVSAGAHLNQGQPFLPEQVEMVYWFADFPGEPARFEYTSAQFQRDWDFLTRLSEEIDSASAYPRTEDRQKCSFCTYRSYCERGVRAGAWEEAEEETQAAELFDVNFEQIGEVAF